jgi:hypothetical protein
MFQAIELSSWLPKDLNQTGPAHSARHTALAHELAACVAEPYARPSFGHTELDDIAHADLAIEFDDDVLQSDVIVERARRINAEPIRA